MMALDLPHDCLSWIQKGSSLWFRANLPIQQPPKEIDKCFQVVIHVTFVGNGLNI